MSETVSISKRHVHLTIAGFVCLLVTIIGGAYTWGVRVEQFRADVRTLKTDVTAMRARVEQLRDMSIQVRFLSIDKDMGNMEKRLNNIEKSALIRASRWYDGSRPTTPPVPRDP